MVCHFIIILSDLHTVIRLNLLIDTSQHLLHSLLISFNVLHLPLQAILHLILDQVDSNPGLPVLDTLIVYSERSFRFSDCMLKF